MTAHADRDRSEQPNATTPDDERVARWEEALMGAIDFWNHDFDRPAIMAVADAEQAELRAEGERLRADGEDVWAAISEVSDDEEDESTTQAQYVRLLGRALADERAKVARVEAARNTWAEKLASGAIRDKGARYCWRQAVREIDDALAGPEPDARRLNCPVCGSGEIGDCVCPEPDTTEGGPDVRP